MHEQVRVHVRNVEAAGMQHGQVGGRGDRRLGWATKMQSEKRPNAAPLCSKPKPKPKAPLSLSLRASLNLIVHSTANSKSSIYNRCNSQFIQQLFTQSYLSYIHYVLKAVLQLAINVYIVCYSSLSSCIFLKYIYSQLLLYLLSLSLSLRLLFVVLGLGSRWMMLERSARAAGLCDALPAA